MVDNKKISAEDQWEYWLGVGMLLYMVKHLHSNPAAYKELLQEFQQTLGNCVF